MTTAAWCLLLALGQAGAPAPSLPPNHPPLPSGGAPSSGTLPPDHPPTGSGTARGPAPAAGAPAQGPVDPGAVRPPPAGELPPGHPSVAAGATPRSTDELLKQLDANAELKGRPKPAEISAALGKLYYGRGRWKEASEYFAQAEATAAPVLALATAERRRAKGPLPTPDAAGCPVTADTVVARLADRAKTLAEEGKHAAAAACAIEALAPVLDAMALHGNALALQSDASGALAAYARVLALRPEHPEALYGHASVTFDTKGDDLAALRVARKELSTFVSTWPALPQTPQAKALLARTDAVLAAGGATKFGREAARARAEAGARAVASAPSMARTPPSPSGSAPPFAGGGAGAGGAGGASGAGAPPTLSRETMQAFQSAERTPELEASLAKSVDQGEAALVSGKYDEALDAFKKVMPYHPEDGRLRAGMAWALVGLQRQPMADRIWGVAVQTDPAAVDALGDRLMKSGNAEAARALWAKLQATAPDYATRAGVQKKLGTR